MAAGRACDPLMARVLEQVLLGVSTRGYAGNLEAALAKALHKNTPSEAAA